MPVAEVVWIQVQKIVTTLQEKMLFISGVFVARQCGHAAGEQIQMGGKIIEFRGKFPSSYQTTVVLETNQKGLRVSNIIGQLLQLLDQP